MFSWPVQVKADVTHRAAHKKRGRYVQSARKKYFVPNTLSWSNSRSITIDFRSVIGIHASSGRQRDT
jgi:hypothetical protein